MDKTNYNRKFWGRIKTVFVPLILWNLIYAIPFVVIRGEKYTIFDIIFSRCCVPMWFLTALIVYLLLMPVIELIIHNKVCGGVVCIMMFVLSDSFVGLVSSFQLGGIYFSEISRYVTFFPVYLLGAYISKHFKDKVYNDIIVKHKAGQVILIIGVLIPLICDLVGYYNMILNVMFVGCLWKISKGDFFIEDKCRYIGDSFGIFAMHTGFWTIVITIFVKLGIRLETVHFNFVLYLFFRALGTTIFVLLSLCCTGIIRKYTPLLYRILYGNRNCGKT